MSFQWEAIAHELVERLDLKPGETFAMVARPGLFDRLIPHIRYEAMKRGAVDLGVFDVIEEPLPEAWDPEVVATGMRSAREALAELLADVDASIMLPGARPGHSAYAAIQDNLKQGRGRTIHFHWTHNGSAFPIAGQPLPSSTAIDDFYQRVLLETDYGALARKQAAFADAMRGNEVRVSSAGGTDLTFRIGDRPINFQDGDASAAKAGRGVILIDREIELPAGAIRVAPIEASVEGTIVFPPSQWDGRAVTELRLTFEKGRVVDVQAKNGVEAARAEMDAAGAAGRAFREFALGFNPLLAIPERGPWIPYYGYGAGVVRLSLGDNSELGGNVGGGYVRWNFFTDLSVEVGEQVWVRDGKLVR